jgi:hypothetical protein
VLSKHPIQQVCQIEKRPRPARKIDSPTGQVVEWAA